MTQALFREDAYRRHCQATVEEVTDQGIVLDATVFYPLGGGQPGDIGVLHFNQGQVEIVDTRHGDGGVFCMSPPTMPSCPGRANKSPRRSISNVATA